MPSILYYILYVFWIWGRMKSFGVSWSNFFILSISEDIEKEEWSHCWRNEKESEIKFFKSISIIFQEAIDRISGYISELDFCKWSVLVIFISIFPVSMQYLFCNHFSSATVLLSIYISLFYKICIRNWLRIQFFHLLIQIFYLLP